MSGKKIQFDPCLAAKMDRAGAGTEEPRKAVAGWHLSTDIRPRGCGGGPPLQYVAVGHTARVHFSTRLVRHQHRQGLLMHEIERHPPNNPS
jgi:hypothetical protein